jgi:putative transposase
LSRSSYYHRPAQKVDELTLVLMRLIDEEYTRHPFIGTRRMMHYLRQCGYFVNRKRVQSLYRKMGVEAIYPSPRMSRSHPQHTHYPYLLRGISITHCDQVWSTDITYVRLKQGFVYLMAIIDWHSRFVLDWQLSTHLEADFCVELLERTLASSTSGCGIFNTDQGAQFTSNDFIEVLKTHDIQVSMDGRGRALDNIFVERLWRSVKYECIYLQEFAKVACVNDALEVYFNYYNHERFHQSLGYKTPAAVYLQ